MVAEEKNIRNCNKIKDYINESNLTEKEKKERKKEKEKAEKEKELAKIEAEKEKEKNLYGVTIIGEEDKKNETKKEKEEEEIFNKKEIKENKKDLFFEDVCQFSGDNAIETPKEYNWGESTFMQFSSGFDAFKAYAKNFVNQDGDNKGQEDNIQEDFGGID